MQANVPGGLIAPNRLSADFLQQMQAQQVAPNAGFPELPQMSPYNPPVIGQMPAPLPTPSLPTIPQRLTGRAAMQAAPGVAAELGNAQVASQQRQTKNQEPFLQAATEQQGYNVERAQENLVVQQKATRLASESTRNIMAQYQQDVEDYKNTQIDPNRAVRGGRGVLAAIGVALGTIGSATAGTPNYALDIVNRAIDRDIRVQELELQKKRGAIDLTGNRLAMMRQYFGDEERARLATVAAEQTLGAERIKLLAAQAAPGEAREKAFQFSLALLQNANENMAKLGNMVADDQYKQAHLAVQREQVQATRAMALATNNLAVTKDLRERLVPDVGFATTKEQANKAIEFKSQTLAALDAVDKALAMYDDSQMDNRSFLAKIGTGSILRTRAIAALTKMANSGVLNAGEYERYADVIANPAISVMPKAQNRAVFQSIRDFLISNGDQTMRDFGVEQGWTPSLAQSEPQSFVPGAPPPRQTQPDSGVPQIMQEGKF